MLNGLLTGYQAAGEGEAADLGRMLALAATVADPWSRSLPLHFTGSALVVHPPSRRVLLRWHARHQLWLQVGGHGDPGERDPLAIALREAREETGLTDLVPWPDAGLLHAVVCHVSQSATEPEHEHADLRYVLATECPDAITPENERSPLRWLGLDEARALVGGNNLRDTLDRLDSVSFSLRLPRVTMVRGRFRWSRCCFDSRNVQEIFRYGRRYAAKSTGAGWCAQSALWYFARVAGNSATRLTRVLSPAPGGRLSVHRRIDSKS